MAGGLTLRLRFWQGHERGDLTGVRRHQCLRTVMCWPSPPWSRARSAACAAAASERPQPRQRRRRPHGQTLTPRPACGRHPCAWQFTGIHRAGGLGKISTTTYVGLGDDRCRERPSRRDLGQRLRADHADDFGNPSRLPRDAQPPQPGAAMAAPRAQRTSPGSAVGWRRLSRLRRGPGTRGDLVWRAHRSWLRASP